MLVKIGCQNGFVNSLFLSTRVGTRVCVSAVCDIGSGYTAMCSLVLKYI
ncbi:hypothetical protein F383_33498 [Gossypium arboreum]|uniref:Uncharacterized protein n=1 Tax=Gossypium arboreum TaxID=29729 RepID=A0A0B0MXQ5_GOSAR|nr:hypothetical protein F383_33498 [Gossypium arboreum]